MESTRTASPTRVFLDAARLVPLKDAPVVAGAVAAGARYLATYDRKHLLNHKEAIQARFGIVVAVPDEVLEQLHHHRP